LPQLSAEHGLIVFMSSIFGSIEAGAGQGMPLYGASKAALNHLAQCFVRTQDNPQLGVLLMHPGWVRTDMGGPNADVEVDASVAGLRRVIADPVAWPGGSFFDWRGQSLAW
jgi:NAD(P)-dependent dehydrogenase (short-subunit alcohol dehydrogenase family)